MKKVTITINSEVYEIQDLGEQQLSSTHLRSDICYHFCDLFKQCSKFLYNAATPCLLAMDHPDEGRTKALDSTLRKKNYEDKRF